MPDLGGTTFPPEPQPQTVTMVIPDEAVNAGTATEGVPNLSTPIPPPITPQEPDLSTLDKQAIEKQLGVIPTPPIPTPQPVATEPPPVQNQTGSLVVESQGAEQDKPKHPGGRPCEYCIRKAEIDKITQDFLELARAQRKAGKPFIPYLQDLADRIGCDSDRVSLWANKEKEDGSLEHEQFYGIIKSVNNLKELLLLQRTTGRYNPTGAIFQLKTKHGYIETEKQIQAGDKEAPLQVQIIESRPQSDD